VTPAELHELEQDATTTVEIACRAIGCGRTLGYQSARETGELAGIRLIRVGRVWRVPTRPLLALLGYDDILPKHEAGAGPPRSPYGAGQCALHDPERTER